MSDWDYGAVRADIEAEENRERIVALERERATLRAERDAYRAAVEWAVAETGYRLGYQANTPVPLVIDYNGATQIRVRDEAEVRSLLVALAHAPDAPATTPAAEE